MILEIRHDSRMPEARVIEWIRQKFVNIAQDLDERGRRRWAASEAISLGRGGITAVADATGISDRTIRIAGGGAGAGGSHEPTSNLDW